jgi:hypothetical protein
LHVMNATADKINAQLFDNVEAFFDIYADA